MNRASRRKAQRELKKAVRTGVGVNVRLAGYRVIRPDGTTRVEAGLRPAEKASNHDPE